MQIVEKAGAVTNAVKRFVWCGLELCEERDSSGAVVKQFFPQGVETGGGEKLFYTRDHLGSVREMVDNSGALRAGYSYDPWGRVTKTAGDRDADFAFTGHYFHALSGLHLAPYRAYSAELGRWVSRDRIAENGGINVYAYAGDRALSYRDSTGEFAVVPVIGAGLVGAAAVVAAKFAIDLTIGDAYALTIKGTDFVFHGRRYYELSCPARSIIDEHEKVHSRQGFFDDFFNEAANEIPAYELQRDLAGMMLLDEQSLPRGSRERDDVIQVKNDAEAKLIEYRSSKP